MCEATLEQLVATDTIFLGTDGEAAVLRSIVAAQARAEIARHDLDRIAIPEIAAAWAEVRDSTQSAQLHDALGRVAAGDTPHMSDADGIGRMVTMTRVGSAFEDQLFRLIERTNTAAHDVAARVAADARDDARRSLLVPGPLALLTLAVSVAFARSITRPMGQLADHAAAIGGGNLNLEPLRARGPRAIQIACRAFDDLVANLRLLDAKSQALADLDFDAAVLAEPLPGQLGQSLQRSVTAVSGSIGERDQLRQRLHQQATQDQLTGLHNRAATSDALDQALARARRSAEGIAVLHVDLDDFKRINETYGNTTGDAVLREVATRLRHTAGDAAFVSRAGGDEFVVLVEGVSDAAVVHEVARGLPRRGEPDGGHRRPAGHPGGVGGHRLRVGRRRFGHRRAGLGRDGRAPGQAAGGRQHRDLRPGPAAAAAGARPRSRTPSPPRCPATSCSCSTSRSSTWPPGACPASRPSCAGNVPTSASSRRTRSSPSPNAATSSSTSTSGS